LNRGRLLYYVAFAEGAAYLNLNNVAALLGIAPDEL